jgi:hypothetical protein
MKKIYLHIGLHKTGTTSLQQYTRKNHAHFRELGLYVPPPGKIVDACGNEINLGSGSGGLHAIPKTIAQRDTSVLTAVLSDFEKSGLDSALISSEGFDSFKVKDTQFLAEQLKDYQVQPIVVFRHPVRLARSIYCSLGRISSIQGNKLIDARMLWSKPRHLASVLLCSRGKSEKISRTNFIILQIKRRIYDYDGISRDWSVFGRVKAFLFEQSNDIAKDILAYVFEKNPKAMNAISSMEIPRLRSSLPVPLAVMNNDLYNDLNIDKKIYQGHIYPNIIDFSNSKEFQEVDLNIPLHKLLPFSSRDQDLLMKKIKDNINPDQIFNYIIYEEQEKDGFSSILESYKNTIDYMEIPGNVVTKIKTKFIQFCLPKQKIEL